MGKQSRRKRIEAMKREIERVGGDVWVNPESSDALTEQFLELMFDCPDCAAAGLRRPNGERRSGH